MVASGEAYVYAILVDGVTRYIGKGRGGRLRDHVRVARNASPGNSYQPSRVHRRLKVALERGASIIAKKVLVNLTDEDALALERRAIAAAEPGSLWNIRAGADRGASSELRKEMWKRPGYRERQSETTLARWRDPEAKDRMLKGLSAAMAVVPKSALSKRSREKWREPGYAQRQAASRADPEYKARVAEKVRATITDEKRKEFGERVVQSWKDPAKKAARVKATKECAERRFPETDQYAVLQLIASRDGISAAEIKTHIPNAKSSIHKLMKKQLVFKVGGKYGLFFASKG